MKKWFFFVIFLFSSCASTNLSKLYDQSYRQKESIYFDIYHAKGYFYKGKGFIMVKGFENKNVIILKCTLDTIYKHGSITNK